MEFNPNELLKKLLKNDRISTRVNELSLSKNQLLEAIPIFIDMSEQIDDKSTKYLTSFYVDNDGGIKRMEVRSTFWNKYKYLDNVKTLDLENIDFEDEKDFLKENSRFQIVKKIKNYISSDKFVKGQYIYGQMGIGKTFVAKRIARKLAIEGYTIGYLTLSNLVAKVKASFNGEGTHEITKLLKSVDFLFLDDIGSEAINPWFRDDILFNVLNHRLQFEKAVFFTSNYSFDKLEQIESKTNNSKFRDYDKSKRLLSRIRGLADEIHLEGKFKR